MYSYAIFVWIETRPGLLAQPLGCFSRYLIILLAMIFNTPKTQHINVHCQHCSKDDWWSQRLLHMSRVDIYGWGGLRPANCWNQLLVADIQLSSSETFIHSKQWSPSTFCQVLTCLSLGQALFSPPSYDTQAPNRKLRQADANKGSSSTRI